MTKWDIALIAGVAGIFGYMVRIVTSTDMLVNFVQFAVNHLH